MGASFSAQISAESNMELRKHVDAAVTKVILDSYFTDITNLANEGIKKNMKIDSFLQYFI